MRASEWQFLCAVHEQPKSCCAIDYCCHTLDWAANVVTDPKIFPSRFVVQGDAHSKGLAVKNLVTVFRRLHRIFAHAWFQHKSVFWTTEAQTGLYVFFKTVCDMYDLLPAENYKLPPEAEGLETTTAVTDNSPDRLPVVTAIVKPPPRDDGSLPGDEENYHPVGRTNTRRHIRSSPSTGSAVTTVMETDEEDSSDVTSRLSNMHISAPLTADDEPEVAEVPVIVERSVIEQVSQITPDEDSTETPTTAEPPLEGEPIAKAATGLGADVGVKDAESATAEVLEDDKTETEESKTSRESVKPMSDQEPLELAKEDAVAEIEDHPSTSTLSSTSIHDFAPGALAGIESTKETAKVEVAMEAESLEAKGKENEEENEEKAEEQTEEKDKKKDDDQKS
jgi:hypothetical protein